MVTCRRRCLFVIVLLGCLAMCGCPALFDDRSQSSDGGGDDDTAGDDDDDDVELPDSDFTSVEPAASEDYLFVVDRPRNSVSRIDVALLSIAGIDVQDDPTQIVITPDDAHAVVLNAGVPSLTIIDVDTREVEHMDVREGINRIALSPRGSFAVGYFDPAVALEENPGEEPPLFGVATLIDLENRQTDGFSLGFDPVDVQFRRDGWQAVFSYEAHIVTADYSTGELVLGSVDLGMDLLDLPELAEVLIHQDGSYAFVRHLERDTLVAAQLDDEQSYPLTYDEQVKEIGLSNTGDLLVLTESGRELLIHDAEEPLLPPLTAELPMTVNALASAETGPYALLADTSTLTDQILVWEGATRELTQLRLEKPVRHLWVTADGGAALINHTLDDVPGEEDIYTDAECVTLMTLQEEILANTILLEDPLQTLENRPGGGNGLFTMQDNPYVGIISYGARLIADVRTESSTAHMGFSPPAADWAWIAEDHTPGRIQLFEIDSEETTTLTGLQPSY